MVDEDEANAVNKKSNESSVEEEESDCPATLGIGQGGRVKQRRPGGSLMSTLHCALSNVRESRPPLRNPNRLLSTM